METSTEAGHQGANQAAIPTGAEASAADRSMV